MSGTVLIYGKRLFSPDWEKVKSTKPDMFEEVTLQTEADIPNMKSAGGTAYVDLENDSFKSPTFLIQLAKSFDKLRIVGISDSVSNDDTIEVAKLGISEILSRKEYQERVASLLDIPIAPEKPAETVQNRHDISAIIGDSPEIQKIKNIIDQLRDVDYPNAIFFGETGTGKDLLAKVMHYTGVRKDCNFIEVNCSAIPDELFESELFGHKKGAFTDAKTDKTGLFEFADNGTIFLDEIGNLSPSAQAKLLKILENRRLRPLGSIEEKDINVRVLAATNADLDKAVASGTFREDLLFRLNLIAIHLPPLRRRREDIEQLARHNFSFYRTLYNKPHLSITDDAIKRLCEHEWPGNVRELRNVIERTVLLSASEKIGAKQINDAIHNGRVGVKERQSITIEIPEQGITLKAIERQVIGEILNLADWNRSEAARILGISRARLRRIMEENNLQENRRNIKKTGSKQRRRN